MTEFRVPVFSVDGCSLIQTYMTSTKISAEKVDSTVVRLLQNAVLRELAVLVELESLPEYVNIESVNGSDTCIFRCSRGHNKGQVLPILGDNTPGQRPHPCFGLPAIYAPYVLGNRLGSRCYWVIFERSYDQHAKGFDSEWHSNTKLQQTMSKLSSNSMLRFNKFLEMIRQPTTNWTTD